MCRGVKYNTLQNEFGIWVNSMHCETRMDFWFVFFWGFCFLLLLMLFSGCLKYWGGNLETWVCKALKVPYH